MTTDEISGKPRVPVGELEELVEEWREEAWTFDPVRNEVNRDCADELEALIERCDYE